VAPVHRSPRTGAAVCAAGLAAALAVGLAFQQALEERARLDAILGTAAPPPPRAPGPEALRRAAEASEVARELGVPWTRLLAELEAASHDTAARVSILQVEPDPVKGLVRITAEVRAMGDAVPFLQRLQEIPALRHPLLESHERRKDHPEHPIRIRLSAEWRT
jgi:hypothetical protein